LHELTVLDVRESSEDFSFPASQKPQFERVSPKTVAPRDKFMEKSSLH